MSPRVKVVTVLASALVLGGLTVASFLLQQRREAGKEEKLKAKIQQITRDMACEQFGQKSPQCLGKQGE